jgi:RNA polymerase sigma-70 factor (ECF subfamily)
MAATDKGAAVQTQKRRTEESVGGPLRGLRAGSSQAWAALYDQLAPGIHRFAVSCLSGDVDTAEDVVIETLALAAQGITRFDPQKSSLPAWIYGIARHRVQAELRWCRRQKSVPAWAQVSFEDLPDLGDGHDLGARTAARLDAQRRVRGLADLLTDAELEMLALSAVQELPVREIGRVVGRSEQATQMFLHRARQKARRTAIEGTLVIQMNEFRRLRDHYQLRPGTIWFEGISDSRRGHETGAHTDLSPVSDEITYSSQGTPMSVWPCAPSHIWKARRDGSGTVNLTEQAGLTGVNLYPRWSPGGTLIAFLHWGDLPGDGLAGPGEVWVVSADGTEARRVPPESNPLAIWPPGSAYRSYGGGAETEGVHAPPVNLLAERPQDRAKPYGYPVWSPDGSRLARLQRANGQMEGEPGFWNQLVVSKADGSCAEVVVENFIPQVSLARPWFPERWLEAWPTFDWREDSLHSAGPSMPTWSPTGAKIAFLAQLPFVSGCIHEAWIYDLLTRRLTKITSGPQSARWLSWR